MILSNSLVSPSTCLVLLVLLACLPWASSFGSSSRQHPTTFAKPHPFPLLREPISQSALQAAASSSSDTSNQETNILPYYEERQVLLDTGVSMKVTLGGLENQQQQSNNNNNKPLLVFLHGSFHGGWCWTEHFFDHYIAQGYTVVAPCWRGTGGTYAGDGVQKVQIQQHVADLESLLQQLPSIIRESTNATATASSNSPEDVIANPVLIAHSFGSLAVMKLLQLHPEYSRLIRGIAMMCGVPPSGNGRMTMRFLRKSLVQSYKITVGFAMKKCLTNAALCRDLFFGGPPVVLVERQEDATKTSMLDDHGISDADIQRYQGYFARDSAATIDLFDLAKQLPSAVAVEGGKAPFDLPPARMVLGARQDFIVDREGVEETARFFDIQEPVYVDSPHDVMLGSQWTNAAHALDRFLEEHFS